MAQGQGPPKFQGFTQSLPRRLTVIKQIAHR